MGGKGGESMGGGFGRISFVSNLVTYIQHNPSRNAAAFRNVDGARVRRIRHDREDFALHADRVSPRVFGFQRSSSRFRYRASACTKKE